VFPHLDQLKESRFVFKFDFGLQKLPTEGGVIAVRGARQLGKSTWLEQQARTTIRQFGPGSALYLNGDEIRDREALRREIREITSLFRKDAKVRRLFIDEITAVIDWQRALKRLVDAGELRDVLLVTTGSKATDLHRGVERLPGRKGRLARTSFLFLPISYREVKRVAGSILGKNTLAAYMISGGSPVACRELAAVGHVPEFAVASVRDWVYGECAASRRDRSSLLAVMEVIARYGGSPLGQAKLAREAGLANNTVAAGYVELLTDLLCVAPAYAWDESRKVPIRRRPYKVHFINLFAATAWHPARVRSPKGFAALEPAEQAKWYEWIVAQELWRRRARRGEETPEQLSYWQSKRGEVDFVASPKELIEVKRGPTSPMEFSWFAQVFGSATLTVINPKRFEAGQVRGIPLEDWLLEG
jgi:predicted AAA+ superfamily ATPase